MKNIQGHILIKDYQSYLVNNNNVELKYMILQFYDEFQSAMIQAEMDSDYAYFLTSAIFSDKDTNTIIPALNEGNIIW